MGPLERDEPPVSDAIVPAVARLEQIAKEEAERYFASILPRFVDRYFRGGGYEFLYRMMQAHDDVELELAGPPPSPKARRMADQVRAACPLEIVGRRALAENGALLLGLFSHSSRYQGLAVDSHRTVEIFLGSFVLMGLATEELARREVLHTIFHEYIHYFESFLLRRHQPLRGREEGDGALETMTLAEAQRRDRRQIMLSRAKWGTIALVALATVTGGALLNRPRDRAPYVSAPVDSAALAAAAEKDARDDALLEENVRTIVATGLGPLDADALIGRPAAYDSVEPNATKVLRPDALRSDPAVPGARATLEGAVRTMYWLRRQIVFPLRVVGVAWRADGTAVALHAVVEPGAGASRKKRSR